MRAECSFHRRHILGFNPDKLRQRPIDRWLEKFRIIQTLEHGLRSRREPFARFNQPLEDIQAARLLRECPLQLTDLTLGRRHAHSAQPQVTLDLR